MSTLSQANQLYDSTNKTSGVWKQIYFYHHKHWRAFSLHLKNQQQMAVLWKTWNLLSDQQAVMEEEPAMELSNLVFSCLQLLHNLHTPLKTCSQFTAITRYSLTVHYLLPVLLLIHDSPSPGHMFCESNVRTMEIAKEFIINLPKRFQIKH